LRTLAMSVRWKSGCSSKSWYSVGTRYRCVTRSASIAASALFASKRGMHTKRPSISASDSSDRTPIVWYSGITPSVHSPFAYRFCATCASAAMRSAWWRRGTPLGLPVVPEV